MTKCMLRTYSHDYPNDTSLKWTDDGTRAEIELTFESEDPDAGTEIMVFGGDSGSSMQELAADGAEELTGWLDRHEGQAEPEELDRVYGEYTRTALFAFEAILKKTAKEEE